MTMPRCCWILSKAGEFPIRYCGAAVNYRTGKDDDGNTVRKYSPWCEEHILPALEQQEAEEREERKKEETPTVVTLRTVIGKEKVEYSVARADEVVWTQTEFFGRDAAHRAGGYAFQAACKEQARQASLIMGEGERVEHVVREENRHSWQRTT